MIRVSDLDASMRFYGQAFEPQESHTQRSPAASADS
ncbi:VOC family protein [Pseudomonas juntendi]|nr:hypothetical protein [Pseudomonas juntendi]